MTFFIKMNIISCESCVVCLEMVIYCGQKKMGKTMITMDVEFWKGMQFKIKGKSTYNMGKREEER